MNRLVRVVQPYRLISARKTALLQSPVQIRFISCSHMQRLPSLTPYVGKVNQYMQKRSFAVVTDKLESLGDSITTAVLLSWSKEPGDTVKEDDIVAVVETDKVTMEIRSKKNGVFVEGLVAAGSEVAVGADLYKIDTSATEVPVNSEATIPNPTPKPSIEPVADSSKTQVVPVPAMGDSITQGLLAKWDVKTGSGVAVDDVVASIETDKVTVEVRAPVAGVVRELFAQEGDDVFVGKPLFSIEEGAKAAAVPPPAKPTIERVAPAASAPAPTKSESAPKAEPVKKEEPKKPSPAKAPANSKPPVGDEIFKGDRSETRVKMTRMRQRIAQRLKESQNTAAMLTTFQEVDMSQLIEMRNRHKETFEKTHGVKLGFMSAFVRAATVALKEMPAVNGVIDDEAGEIVYRNYVDVSVAVASPAGLVVPVLRNTEKMNFADVEKAIAHYSKKAKEGTLALEDMTGGTFTISNGGVFGSLFGTPIINPPQSAILGMHATKMRPVVLPDGTIAARPMMYLALTYDHRLIDGREAVTFLKSIQGKIEDPTRLVLDL